MRSRSHLLKVIPALQQAKLHFSAIEVESLGHLSVIQDLLALTRALLHPLDRVAWLSVLRAPWCGLTLKDLHEITAIDFNEALLTLATTAKKLSQDGKQRLQRVLTILQSSLTERARTPLSVWIENTWLSLGGPACANVEEFSAARAYFQLLQQFSYQNCYDFAKLENKVYELFAPPSQQDDLNLQIMTIHKAKGLEFDHVIIPCLERKPAVDQQQLLLFTERPRAHDSSDLVLAPIKAATETGDAIYQYLRLLEKQKARFEAGRLFYVACTRAKQNLHLLTKIEDNDNFKPNPDSFLAMLWPYCQSQLLLSENNDEIVNTLPNERLLLRRLTSNWQHPSPHTYAKIITGHSNTQLQSQTPKQIGTVMHEILQTIADTVANTSYGDIVNFSDNDLRQKLIQHGILPNDLPEALLILKSSLNKLNNDAKAKWILADHELAENEYPITTIVNNTIQHFIIDRTFIENGIRWIIDYKITQPNDDENLESFLSKQTEKYREQLNNYAKAMQTIECLPIKCAIYFPLCQTFREWEYRNVHEIT